MKPADNINNLFKNSKITVGSNVDKKIINKAANALPRQAIQPDRNIWSIIMHSKITKPLAAAIVLIAVSVSLIYWISNKGIQIPPELASMSTEELIKLHYESGDSEFSAEVIEAALKQSLETSDPEQVIQIAKGLSKNKGIEERAELMAPPHHPIPHVGYTQTTFHDVLEKTDFFVHANLGEIAINVDDIIKTLLEKKQFQEEDSEFFRLYRVTIPLEIIKTQPEGVYQSGDIVALKAAINKDKLNALRSHTEFYFGMTLNKNNEPGFLGVYAVDNDNPANVEFWQFIADVQDMLQCQNIPTQEVIDYWISKLTGATFELALEYMDVLPDERIPASALMDTIETEYYALVPKVQQGYKELEEKGQINNPYLVERKIREISSSSTGLFIKVMELLLRTGDRDSINRMLVLFDSDIDYGDRSALLWRFNLQYDIQFKVLIVRLLEMIDDDVVLSDHLWDLYEANRDATWRDRYAVGISKSSAGKDYSDYTKISGLSKCQTYEEAVTKALELLAMPVTQEDPYETFKNIYRNKELLLFLGTTERKDILETIEDFIQVNDYLQDSIKALARIGGEGVIPQLRQFYDHPDPLIKFIAALGLYYNGDMAGEDIIRQYVDRTICHNPELYRRGWNWQHNMNFGTVFQSIIESYLRNDLTDALWIEKMTNYLDCVDTNTDSDFFMDYEPEILQIALEHLNNRDRAVRGYAVSILRNATGQNFGFDPNRYHGRQDAIIQQWREYVDQEYLIIE